MKKIKKILVNIFVSFILEKNKRDRIRKILLGLEEKIEVLDRSTVELMFNDNLNKQMNEIQKLFSIQKLHSDTFGGYKNIYNGKDVVLVGSGPSLNKFKIINDAIYVGVNSVIKTDKVTLDYYFFVHYWNDPNSYGWEPVVSIEDVVNYKNKGLKCFYGIFEKELIPGAVIPESFALKCNAKRYYIHSTWGYPGKKLFNDFAYDLTTEPIINAGSIVFQALQFVLYTNPRKVYLVGCDCSTDGHFHTQHLINKYKIPMKDVEYQFEVIFNGWVRLKQFIQMYYPDIEIISVNPVRLRGLFKDIDQ